MSKAFFIDTSRCTACRGCQIACKEWKGLPAVPTKQRGSHQNPPDLTPYNFKLVRFNEYKIDGKVHWLFFPDQCRHCLQPPCKMVGDMDDDQAILYDDKTGAVIFTDRTKNLYFEEVRQACPYDIPRLNEETGIITKCDMCIDRVNAGMLPACVKVCPTGTMNFGDREEMLELARKRLKSVQKDHPEAYLLGERDLAVIFLLTQERTMYHEFASNAPRPSTRKQFFSKLRTPLNSLAG